MTPITFTHANTKREVVVTREMVFVIQYSEAHRATHLISNGGAVIPVAESVETARGRIYDSGVTNANKSKEDNTNGT